MNVLFVISYKQYHPKAIPGSQYRVQTKSAAWEWLWEWEPNKSTFASN